MNGYETLVAHCGICDNLFTANPDRVPCFPCNMSNPPGIGSRLDANGRKEPVCRDCFNAINALRKEHGLPEHPIPEGAYD